ncbi:hypothetical protein COO60DRAFT_1623382 [Scenedesmus sp. NREL 46B-D3]|nr:hypothetical protein COO60DRAFT_1623382 [Scenedesmus sp. NREL 46B-D3]
MALSLRSSSACQTAKGSFQAQRSTDKGNAGRQRYWVSKSERKGANPMKDPLAIIGLVAIFLPFGLLLIAISTGLAAALRMPILLLSGSLLPKLQQDGLLHHAYPPHTLAKPRDIPAAAACHPECGMEFLKDAEPAAVLPAQLRSTSSLFQAYKQDSSAAGNRQPAERCQHISHKQYLELNELAMQIEFAIFQWLP